MYKTQLSIIFVLNTLNKVLLKNITYVIFLQSYKIIIKWPLFRQILKSL